MITAALFIYIGVQIGAPGWYYLLISIYMLCRAISTVIDVLKER